MKTVAIIPARGGSKGIKNKNIIEVAGKPLVVWSIEQALQSKSIEAVFVTTDDEKIAEISEKAGAKVIKRPEELSLDTATSEAALLHAINVIEEDLQIDFEIVVFLQATSPVRESLDIDHAFEKFNRENLDSLFSCCKVEDRFVWEKQGEDYQSITYDYRNRQRRQDIKPRFLENGSIYIFKKDILRQTSNRLGGKIGIYEMPFWKSFQIDKEEDIDICEYYLNRLCQKNG
ncbi:MAG: acylneuraminate cytidylyltransferase family protein [Candidatus Omnitrophica bacterium]|nr:acylneuraminate cytidylyltransferase family protein [Candidatus Omnitrophota bacterium]